MKQRVMDVPSEIPYQRGGTVSRTLMRTNGGVVTLFAFDENEVITDHAVPHEVMVYVLEGNLSMTVSGETFTIKTGEALFMKPHETHSLRAVSPVKLLLIQLK